jgi:hypothetical protein
MICTSAKYYYWDNQVKQDDVAVKCDIHAKDEMNK